MKAVHLKYLLKGYSPNNPQPKGRVLAISDLIVGIGEVSFQNPIEKLASSVPPGVVSGLRKALVNDNMGLICWRDKPVALSIVQARLVGLGHFSVGYILVGVVEGLFWRRA